MLEVRLLGSFDLRRAGVSIALPSRPAQSLLAYLLLNPGVAHRREELAGLLWPNTTDEKARNNLRHELWRLRRAIEEKQPRRRADTYLHSDDISIAFNANSKFWLDVSIFERASREKISTDDLISALALYRGELLVGFGDEWVLAERQRLQSIFEQMMKQLLNRLSDEQRWTHVHDWAEHWIRLDQSAEAAYRALMLFHSQAGEMSKVAAVYQRCVQVLRSDLGVEPSPETRDLFERLKTAGQAISPQQKILSAQTPSGKSLTKRRPSGTVTFLFTDIESSTQEWEKDQELMQRAFKRHETIIHEAVTERDGYTYKMTGDGFQVAFATARDALDAAIDAQRALGRGEAFAATRLNEEQDADKPTKIPKAPDLANASPLQPVQIRVRMALHTGVTEERVGDYVGPILNRAARLLSAAHGGQILISEATEALLRDQLPANVSLRDLGKRRLKDLIRPEHIYQAIAPDLPADFPPLRTLDTLPNNLPAQLTSFIGREKEIGEIKRLLAPPPQPSLVTDKGGGIRLLTLTGIGGVGKTRLALQAGADLLENFGDGVWLIELASISDPALVLQTIATTLGLREQTARSFEDLLKDYLRQKNLLLILDNCEHLIDACAHLSSTLLRACPQLKILASSRQPMNISGEMTLPVPTLSLPERKFLWGHEDSADSEAVRLFIERAQSVLPAFSVTRANVKTVAQICNRLDGLPLAIELAAARVDMLSLEEINRGMDNRFRLLTGGKRTEMPRHQTLRGCLDWSWNLLSEAEQILFRRLSALAGAWTLEDAEEVTSDKGHVTSEGSVSLPPVTRHLSHEDVFDLLASLVKKSLVSVEVGEDVSRYHLAETIRLYAFEQLKDSGEAARLAAQHRDWYLHLAEAFDTDTREKKQTTDWIARLAIEQDNLRAALEWCQNEAEGAGKGLRLSGALGRFWEKQNALTEGREWLGKFLELSENSLDTFARERALYAAGGLASLQGDHANAIRFFEQCLKLESQDTAHRAQTHSDLGWAFYRRVDYESAAEHLHQAIQLGESKQDSIMVALAQMRLGSVYHETGDLDRAVASHSHSLEAFRLADQEQYVAAALNNLGRIYYQRTDYEQAIGYYQQAIRLLENLEFPHDLCVIYNNLSEVYIDLGDFNEAVAHLKKCMPIAEMLENDLRRAMALGNLAECELGLGEISRAMDYVTRALGLVKTIQSPQNEGVIYRIRGEIQAALGQTEKAREDFETARGLLEPLNQRSRLARLYRSYGKLLMAESNTRAQGIEQVERALALFEALGSSKEVEKTKTLLDGSAQRTSQHNFSKGDHT